MAVLKKLKSTLRGYINERDGRKEGREEGLLKDIGTHNVPMVEK